MDNNKTSTKKKNKNTIWICPLCNLDIKPKKSILDLKCLGITCTKNKHWFCKVSISSYKCNVFINKRMYRMTN